MNGWQRSAAVVAVGVLLAGRAPVVVQGQPALRAQSLGISENLYLLSGSGGNALMMTADEGTVLVDTGAAASAEQLEEIATTISDRPITTIIYTHAHPDHIGGGSAISGTPQIVGHPATRLAMERQGLAGQKLPSTLVPDVLTILDGPDRMDIRYVGVGHTAGDLIVVFPGKRTAYLGDLFPGKTLPVVDRAAGGSYVALPDTLDRALAEVKGVTRVVPGHTQPPPGSPVGRWITLSDLQEYAKLVRGLVEGVRSGLESGTTAEALTGQLLPPDRFPGYDLEGASAVVAAIADEVRSAGR